MPLCVAPEARSGEPLHAQEHEVSQADLHIDAQSLQLCFQRQVSETYSIQHMVCPR